MANIRKFLDERVTQAMRKAYPGTTASSLIASSDASLFGDYQANGAMSLGKEVGEAPYGVANKVVQFLDVAEVVTEPEVAGPGFINFRLKEDWVAEQLGKVNQLESDSEDRLGVERAEKPETIVVDYSAPNLAKEMHVGHLRSTIIGDALVRVLEFVKHKDGQVIRQNHVGDWGTQFGMLIERLSEDDRVWDAVAGLATQDARSVRSDLLRDLEALYREAKQRFDSDPQFAWRARERVIDFQTPRGVNTRHLWEFIRKVSLTHAEEVYARLGVLLRREDVRGESAYEDKLFDVVAGLGDLLEQSEGAQCVFLPEFTAKDGSPLPLIVQKSDEGYLYSTTDLAAIAFRTGVFEELPPGPDGSPGGKSPNADRILYVVDARQSLHFRMVFECAYKAGFADRDKHDLKHVDFGMMLGPDNRPFKTREGSTVKLMDLLDEAEGRAFDLVTEKNPDLPEAERRDIARIVGIGGVKYADLAQNRASDYVFSWDKMLSLQGNTAPYMQYAYARIRSIFRKGRHDEAQTREDASPIPVLKPPEAALGKTLLRFPEALDRALEDYRPNVLAAYLYDLAQAFTAFYDACPVIKSREPTRTHRLKLCDLTARVIAKGLGLLGIDTAERM